MILSEASESVIIRLCHTGEKLEPKVIGHDVLKTSAAPDADHAAKNEYLHHHDRFVSWTTTAVVLSK